MWLSRRALTTLTDLVASLKAENSDLRAQVRFLTQASHDRETKLIDRILAVSHPAAHREIHPTPHVPRATPEGNNGPHRVWFPGVGMTPPPAPRPSPDAGPQVRPAAHARPDEGSDPSPATTKEQEDGDDAA